MNFDALPRNLARVREDIARVQSKEGLSGSVQIVAVTKGHAGAAISAAFDAGLVDIGENRVQEALQKQDAFAGLPVRWHLIGHLQTNKAKFVPGRFALVHSVDSVRVADALQRACERHGPNVDSVAVLLQVNVVGEGQKSGCRPDAAVEIAAHIAQLPALELRGLMTMAPLTADERTHHAAFAGLRGVRDTLVAAGIDARELSMGMSQDYRAAVAEGATILRLGTVLFGDRPR